MSKLNATAKAALRNAGITQVGWARMFGTDNVWRGDACGCPDDRCIGYHHGEAEACQCLPAMFWNITPTSPIPTA